MWLFTKYGMFSVVAARKLSGNHFSGQIDPSRLMIRARVRNHIENLQNRFTLLRGFDVMEDKAADYRYRIVVPKGEWSKISGELAEEIDYGNFKGVCERSGSVDKQY